MQRLACLAVSAAAVRDWNRPPPLGTTSPEAVASVPFKNPRRETCSAVVQMPFMISSSTSESLSLRSPRSPRLISMIEPEFRRVDQHPDRIGDQGVRFRVGTQEGDE